jgi:hypothetical protein
VVLSALVTIPWLVVGGVYLARSAGSTRPPVVEGSVAEVEPGPWGRLSAVPLVVSPPIEYVSTARHPQSRGLWGFPGMTAHVVESFLTGTGMAPEQVERLRSAMRPDPQIGGVVLRPEPEVLRALSPDVRARLYSQLARFPGNVDQAQAFRFTGGTLDRWLSGGVISARTRALVSPLIYRDGQSMYFADVNLIRDELDPDELQRLYKVLNRRSTWLLRIGVDAADQPDELAQYWGLGGRRTDVRAVLESLQDIGPEPTLDIVHLLPPLARNNLYRFPRLTPADLERPVIANCLWSALNFFNDVPDDRFLDVKYALDVLKHDYYVVRGGLQLGDVLAFLDTRGNIFHVAVYVADDYLFTKNGLSAMAPWTLSKLEDVKEVYRFVTDNPQILVNRHKRF